MANQMLIASSTTGPERISSQSIQAGVLEMHMRFSDDSRYLFFSGFSPPQDTDQGQVLCVLVLL
jgi:hypothetical protein